MSPTFHSVTGEIFPISQTLFNLPYHSREHNLVMLFGKFGNVEDAEIIYNDKGSKGFGFVTMSRGQDADNALIRLNHAIVEGRIIEVNLASQLPSV